MARAALLGGQELALEKPRVSRSEVVFRSTGCALQTAGLLPRPFIPPTGKKTLAGGTQFGVGTGCTRGPGALGYLDHALCHMDHVLCHPPEGGHGDTFFWQRC